MTHLETLRLQRDERGVVTLTLDRPDKHNALSATMIDELHQVARELSASPGLRALVLRADGASFCAGGDLAWMRAQFESDRAGRITEARRLAMMLKSLNELPVPVIARVHGGAYGGGLGLLCVCDIVVASTQACFALSETRLGLIPATISPYVVARLGEGATRRMALTARMFDADQALALGLIATVVDPNALDDAVAAELAPLAKTSPAAVASTKQLLRALGPPIDEAVIEASIERLADTWDSSEAVAGVEAFLDRRAPPWAKR